jgi:hypothetical protein
MVCHDGDHEKDVVVMKESKMNLLDKYVAEVGKHLPRKNRADIESEIRSTLEDMLEERKQDKVVDDALVMSLLKEYGAPKQVAATYKATQYLIGPRMYPLFEMVTRIVFIVFFSVSLLGLGIGLAKTGLTGAEFLSQMGKWLAGLFSGLTAALGNIVIVFAILERIQVADEFEKEAKDWDPAELTLEPDPAQTKVAEFIVAIIFTVLGLVILNLYSNLISINFHRNGAWTSIPVLTDAFFNFLPWINIMGILQIGFNACMLSQTGWKPATRILDMLVDVAGAVLTIAILTTPGIISITPETFIGMGITEAADILTRLIGFVPKIIMAIVVVVTIIKGVQTSIELFKGRSTTPYPVIK